MSNIINYIVFFVLCINKGQGKIFNNCELAKTLIDNGIVKEEVGNWVCIAKHESEFNTQAINGNTGDYGIFQISHIYWCSDGDTPGNGCKITCNALLNDDISDDIKCAKTIYEETQTQKGCGYCAWVAYNQYCSNSKNEEYVSGCNL